MLKQTYVLSDLPPAGELETSAVLRQSAIAHRHLAELKGRAAIIPNQAILIDTLALQEAKASSEIESIFTTQDELFQLEPNDRIPGSPAAKEVERYRDALKCGFMHLHKNQGLLTNNSIIEMFQVLKQTTERFRSTSGTAIFNPSTNEIVFVPPQDHNEIIARMSGLEQFMNDDQASDLDPLVKMALIHHQFESIHPFSDGNGRIGRILNVLYLTRMQLLEIPILYLSRYITANKPDYYRLLQSVRSSGDWEAWILYMLRGVAETAKQTLQMVEGIHRLMTEYKRRMRDETEIYSQELLNNLFRHPYTRIDYVQGELGISRQTAAKYLDVLTAKNMVSKIQVGKHNYYVNIELVDLFAQVSM